MNAIKRTVFLVLFITSQTMSAMQHQLVTPDNKEASTKTTVFWGSVGAGFFALSAFFQKQAINDSVRRSTSCYHEDQENCFFDTAKAMGNTALAVGCSMAGMKALEKAVQLYQETSKEHAE